MTKGSSYNTKIIKKGENIMKKVISIIMTAVILATLALPTFAAESSFVESIKVKPAPEVVVASIVDRDNNKKEDVTADQLIITPYRPGEQSDIQKELHNVYDEIDKNGAPAIFSDEDAASVKKDGLKLDKLVVSDLFDIFYTKENTLSEDNKLNITFKTKIDLKKKSVVVMVKNNGTWTRVPAKEIKILENGQINISFTKICPVVFLIEDTPSKTSDAVSLAVWTTVAAASLTAMVLIIVFRKKSKKSEI